MSRCYRIAPADLGILASTESLLMKTLCGGQSRPEQMVTISKLLYSLESLPRVSEKVNARLHVNGPEILSGALRTQYEWEVTVELGIFSVECSCHVSWDNGDFEDVQIVTWTAKPEQHADLVQNIENLQRFPGIESFSESVMRMDFSSVAYTILVGDEDNPLLVEVCEARGQHDHYCPSCAASTGCSRGKYCHSPTERTCGRHGFGLDRGWYIDEDVHVHECLQCEPHDSECVATFDWIHEAPQCIEPRFWPCENHRRAKGAG